jgi:transmembrane sensor
MHAETVQLTVPMKVAVEAADWITRLHGPERTPQMEHECLVWQSRSQAHRLAFARCTATWEEVRALPHWALSHTSAAALLSRRGRERR